VIFPANFEEKLGFHSIRKMIRENCLCDLGKQSVDSIHFMVDLQEIETNLFQTDELRRILLFEGTFPSQDYYDLTPVLSAIRLEGSFMEPEELSKLKLSLNSILEIQSFFTNRPPEKYPCLLSLSKEIAVDRHIPGIIGKIIDDKSEIRDDASPELRKIRKERSVKQAAVEKKIAQSFKLASKSGWTPDDTGLTIRNGRLVIPLLATHKRKISGLIHDESATGQTVYLEPAEIVEMNNEIKELDFAERREIIRILIEFADRLRPFIDDLIRSYHILGRFDFTRAKARVSIEMNALLPLIRIAVPHIHWKKAIHPLLFISHSLQKKTVVPLDISLTPSQRILIISGPNAGGKSVCLKTVGLVQYIYQCGLLPPADPTSEFGIFRKIFIDIGDEQSLENDLSTYSSKLLNLKYFIEHLDENSLFLIDELGTGTDPSLGGPIAEASLEKMHRLNAFGVVTTHYSNLKLLAGRFTGIENGAMLYDSKKLQPLFILKTGLPGSSFAFEIARQIGFPDDVLRNASEKTGNTQLDFDKQIQDIEQEKAELVKKSTEVKVADEFLLEMIKKYQKLYDTLNNKKEEIITNAKDEASRILKESNKMVEKTIKEIRESQAEKNKTLTARKELKEFKENLEQSAAGSQQLTNSPDHQITRSPIHQITNSPDHQFTSSPPPKSPYQSYLNELQTKLENFQLTLDLRGKRAEESLSILQHYIDDAILLNLTEVRILHGKGNGILRQITRDYLRSIKEIKKYQDAPLEQGGAGITVINFK